jgi:hypothetical protein
MDADDDAHSRRLVGPIAADESEQLARPYLEAQLTERDEVAVAFREPADLEHRASLAFASADQPEPRVRAQPSVLGSASSAR